MPITWEVVAATITVLGFVSGIWWRVEGMIRKNTDDLSAYKLHVSEAFVTKVGMQQQTDQLLRAIEGIGQRIDGLNERIDRLHDQPAPRSRRTGA